MTWEIFNKHRLWTPGENCGKTGETVAAKRLQVRVLGDLDLGQPPATWRQRRLFWVEIRRIGWIGWVGCLLKKVFLLKFCFHMRFSYVSCFFSCNVSYCFQFFVFVPCRFAQPSNRWGSNPWWRSSVFWRFQKWGCFRCFRCRLGLFSPLRVEAPPAMVPWQVLVQVVDTWAVRKGWKWWKDGIGWNDLSNSKKWQVVQQPFQGSSATTMPYVPHPVMHGHQVWHFDFATFNLQWSFNLCLGRSFIQFISDLPCHLSDAF